MRLSIKQAIGVNTCCSMGQSRKRRGGPKIRILRKMTIIQLGLRQIRAASAIIVFPRMTSSTTPLLHCAVQRLISPSIVMVFVSLLKS